MYHTAKILQTRLVGSSIRVLDLNVSTTLTTFLPGQWVDFCHPPHHSWIGGFSIASSPHDLPKLTLAVRASNHAPSKWVHEEAQSGDCVEIQVGGNCVLPDTNRPVVFCAGGIGIAPILSQYRELLKERQDAPVSLLYSVGKEEDLVFQEEIIELARVHHKMGDRLVFTLTKDRVWGEKLHQSTFVDYRNGRQVQSFLEGAPQDAIFSLCGPPEMVHEAEGLLIQRGVPPSCILYEKWW